MKAENDNSLKKTIKNKLIWILPTLMYGLNFLPKIIDALTHERTKFTAKDEIAWMTDHIIISMGIISFFTIFFVSTLSIINIYTDKRLKE